MLQRLVSRLTSPQRPALRLVTWNCAMALRNKWDQLASLAPDVAVIQECEQPEKWPAGAYTSAVWHGSNKHKGLAIVAFGDWRVEACAPADAAIELVLPARISGPVTFNLLGVWTKATQDRRGSYIGQMLRAAQVYASWLVDGDSVVMGDWNSNAGWYRTAANPHMDAVARLDRCGLTSAYHAYYGLAHGAERHATWYNHKRLDRPFHLDYCFLPQTWLPHLRHVTVGGHEAWMAWSDHCPLVVEVGDLGDLATLCWPCPSR